MTVATPLPRQVRLPPEPIDPPTVVDRGLYARLGATASSAAAQTALNRHAHPPRYAESAEPPTTLYAGRELVSASLAPSPARSTRAEPRRPRPWRKAPLLYLVLAAVGLALAYGPLGAVGEEPASAGAGEAPQADPVGLSPSAAERDGGATGGIAERPSPPVTPMADVHSNSGSSARLEADAIDALLANDRARARELYRALARAAPHESTYRLMVEALAENTEPPSCSTGQACTDPR